MHTLAQVASQWTPAAIVTLVGAVVSGIIAVVAAIRSGANASTLIDHQNTLTDQSATLEDHAQQLSELTDAVLGPVLPNAGPPPAVKPAETQAAVVKTVLMVIGLASLFTVASATQGCAAIVPGADPVIVNAQRTQQAAFATVNAFLTVDNANRATMSASLHAAAEKLRQVYPTADGDLTQAIATYQTANTSANASALEADLQLVLSFAAEAQSDIVQFQQLASPGMKPATTVPAAAN